MKKPILIAFLFVSPLCLGQDVYLIGTDASNKEVISKADAVNVTKSLSKALETQKIYALEVLEKNQDKSNWSLDKFTVGLGIEGEAGIGPWNLGLAIKQRLEFKKSEGDK